MRTSKSFLSFLLAHCLLVLGAVLILTAGTAAVQAGEKDARAMMAQPEKVDHTEQLAYTIGVQAYIFGYPMMDLYRTLYETSLDPKRDHDRTLNEFFFFRRLITSEDDWVVTPNEDTLYHRAFLDLSEEPVVLVIPKMGKRPYWFPVSNMYHNFDANLSWDTIGEQGGNYALCPPGWAGVLPDGVKRIDVSTRMIWTLGRYAVNGKEDIPAVNALQDKTRLVPLSQWGKSRVRRPKVERKNYPKFTREDLTDGSKYFTVLNEMLRRNPPPGKAAGVLSSFREIGLHPTQQFEIAKLSPAVQRGLKRAATDGHRFIRERMDRSLPIINGWMQGRVPKDMSHDPVNHAAIAMLGLLYNPIEVSTYDVAFVDGKGAPLDGRKRYVLKFDPPPPVNAFWSLTMYSVANKLFVKNPISRYSVGDRTTGLVYGKDGSLEIYLQDEEPSDQTQRANWLPAPSEPFYMVMRHYSPRHPIVTGDWRSNGIENR